MRKSQLSFNEFRNSVNIYKHLQDWRTRAQNHIEHIHKVFQYPKDIQLETVLYINGWELPAVPKGLLLYHNMGVGKTLTSLMSGFYAIGSASSVRKMLFFAQRGVREKTIEEARNYLAKLNERRLGLCFEKRETPIDVDQLMDDSFEFLVINTPKDMEDQYQYEHFNSGGWDDKFVVVDEAHNLFRSINNGCKNACLFYTHVLTNPNTKIICLSGTMLTNSAQELAIAG
jgi:hypothetical protein